MKILITGATGFLGSHINDLLQEQYKNYEIITWDRQQGDLKTTTVYPQVDVVIHLAAYNSTKDFYTKAFEVIKDNILTTINLLEYYKQQAKTLFKKLGQNSSSSHASGAGGAPPSRMSYESGEYFMHYVIESGVCYLTLCERNYPKKLAYSYLEGERKQNSFLFFAYIRFD